MTENGHIPPRNPGDESAERTGPGPDREPEDDPEAYIKIPGYRLVTEINRGGQAVIFEAVQKSTGRRVAIKLLSEGPWGSDRAKSRMEREVQILAALDHPNIVSVIDRGETEEGWMFFVLEYVKGETLSEYLDEYRRQHGIPKNPAGWAPLLRLFMRVCDAVNAAHLRGIVHRDVKPSNIIIDAHGEPHVLDFGVAHPGFTWHEDESHSEPVTASGEFLGSLQWASPEQADGNIADIDTRSDVYSLGVVFYEMLTGEFPYEVFVKVREVLNNIVSEEARPPSEVLREQAGGASQEKDHAPHKAAPYCDAVLDGIALKALAKHPGDRYQTAGDFSRDIGRYLAGGETAAGGRVDTSRWRVPVGLVAVAVLALAAGAVWWRGSRSTETARDTVTQAEDPVIDYRLGYRVEGREVVFVFDPRFYDTVRMADGTLGKLDAVQRLQTVAVAGSFNDWEADDKAWRLKEIQPNRFALRKPLHVFKDRDQWTFKFVVNKSIWVGAPEAADNKEVVLEDTATYNLVLRNPAADLSAGSRQLLAYRKPIDAAWPGQGANLALDEEGRYHLTLSHLPRSARLYSLAPLEGLPLTTLDTGDAHLTNLDALKGMETLTRLRLGAATRSLLFDAFRKALAAEDLAAAADALTEMLADYGRAPAFNQLGEMLSRGLRIQEALSLHPAELTPDAWSFEGHRYALIPEPMTWAEARAYSENTGGHLAAITSKDEQAWITETFGFVLLGEPVWLGGTDEQYEGRWGWLSGEPWVFDNWTHPEPNNEGGSENALAMRFDGWWFDTDADSVQLPFLLEWAP